MIGNTVQMTTQDTAIPAKTLFIPLQFWFCRNAGLALPLIALQYHEVKFNIQFRTASECYVTDDGLAPSSAASAAGRCHTGVPLMQGWEIPLLCQLTAQR